jgi:cyanate lyase
VAEILEIPVANAEGQLGSHWWPNRGLGPMPPQDPVIYRLYEVRDENGLFYALPLDSNRFCLQGVLVYGHAIKAIIHEKVRLFPPPTFLCRVDDPLFALLHTGISLGMELCP